MINEMVQLNTMHVGKTSFLSGNSKLAPNSNNQNFGSVLATLTGKEAGAETASNEKMMAEQISIEALLQATTTEEIQLFLQKNAQIDVELPLITDGHFIFFEKSLLELLSGMMPDGEQIEFAGNDLESDAIAINIWQLIEQLETAGFAIGKDFEQGQLGTSKLSQEQMIQLFAFMKMASIELPKLDLTLKQEQQLLSLQKFSAQLGSLMDNVSKDINQNRFSFLPIMEMKQPTQLNSQLGTHSNQLKETSNETIGQQALPFSSIAKVDGMHTEHVTRENSRAELLMRELQNVFKRSNFGQAGGTNRISVRLYPEHLGQLRIELLQVNGLVTARILASSALGKEMLESHLHQLRNAFLQQNIQVERIDVSQMLNEAPYADREQAFGKQFNNQEDTANEQNEEQQDEDQMTFQEYLIEIEV